ncbi:MAG: extracellular solute-binding protein [Chloroflexi bacterium]|nr:extracellular solute-binding protein [Chloroflexota bacterium]
MLRFVAQIIAVMVLIGLIFGACGPTAAPAPVTTPPEPKAPAAAGKAAWEVEWGQVLAAARKEGKVVLYTTRSGDTGRQLAEAFEKKFGIQLEFLVGRGEEITQRMLTERAAGLYLADVTISGTSSLLISMKPQGLIDKIEPLLLLPEVTDPQAWVTNGVPFADKDRTTIGIVASTNRYVARNTELTREGEVTSYKDVLDPRWKGKIASDDPTVTGTGNAFFTFLATQVWGLEQTKEFMRQFVKQEPALTRDKRLSAEWVARGKYALGVAPTHQTVIDFARAGAPIAWVKVSEGTKAATSGGALGIMAKRPHPNATRVFVNWVLGSEGHAVFVKAQGMPGARRDAPREGVSPEQFPDPGEKVYPETEDSILFGEEMMKVSREIFAPLMKQ